MGCPGNSQGARSLVEKTIPSLALLTWLFSFQAFAAESALVKPKMQWTDPARLPKGEKNTYGPAAYVPEPTRGNDANSSSDDFGLSSPTFRAWITELCQKPADAQELAESRKTNGLWTTVRRPKNALGTFLLLLENYELDLVYLGECTEARKLFATACKRGKPGPRPGRELGEEIARDNSPEDTFSQYRSAMRLEKKAIRQLFGRLKETSFLDGSPESIEKARKIRQAAEYTSTCRLRTFDEQLVKNKTAFD